MATTTRSTVEIVEQLYAAFNRGDIEECVAGFADDITWIEPEGSPISGGTYTGPDAVKENVIAPLSDYFDEFGVDVDRFIDAGDTVVVEGQQRGTMPDGDVVEIPCAHIVDMKDGKVQRFASYEDTALGQQLLGE